MTPLARIAEQSHPFSALSLYRIADTFIDVCHVPRGAARSGEAVAVPGLQCLGIKG